MSDIDYYSAILKIRRLAYEAKRRLNLTQASWIEYLTECSLRDTGAL